MRTVVALLQNRFTGFLGVGAVGATINLALTWLLTSFVFGLSGYFKSYVVATAVNLAFNFILYSVAVFRTSRNHGRRLILFVTYSLAATVVQAFIVRALTPLVGLHFYLLVIASVILLGAILNFFVFKHALFRES